MIKTREELLDKINKEGGKWNPQDGISFEILEDGATKSAVKAVVDGVGFYLWNHVDEVSGMLCSEYIRVNEMERMVNAVIKLRAFFGIVVEDQFKSYSSTIIVEDDSSKAEEFNDEMEEEICRLQGKVSVYEDLFTKKVTLE